MNIGQAANQSGLPVKTLRYYEEIGLVQPARSSGNDYRDYSSTDVEHLRFLQRARAVGFGLHVCRELLELYRDENRRCSQVKKLVLEKIDQVEAQLQELHALKSALTDMANGCAGDDSTDCTIIETLAQPKPSLMPFMLVESSS
ncbi:MAG: MerR family transcriptional regulator [Sphingobacteriaceae bacterium]|nr:MAG: MerR family transcriptional regulator [Sphingobacteriaceae bacterium]